MCIFDRAQQLEANERERLINQVRAQAHRGESPKHCERCGGEIGKERCQALPGVNTCIECARRIERNKQMFGGR